MPGRDGTGPAGAGGGGGMGRRAGGGGMGRKVGGGGRMGGPLQAGPEGFCVCPKCGAKVPHQRAMPCSSVNCPQCGSAMVRGS